MDRIRIKGGRPLNGTIPISGAKNATLPLMIASLLTDETLILENVPRLADVALLQRAAPHVLQRLEAREECRKLPFADVQLLLRLHQRVRVEHALHFGGRDAGLGPGLGAGAAGAARLRGGRRCDADDNNHQQTRKSFHRFDLTPPAAPAPSAGAA